MGSVLGKNAKEPDKGTTMKQIEQTVDRLEKLSKANNHEFSHNKNDESKPPDKKVSLEDMFHCLGEIMNSKITVGPNELFYSETISIDTFCSTLNNLPETDIHFLCEEISQWLEIVFVACVAQCRIHWPDKRTLRRFTVATVGFVYQQLKNKVIRNLVEARPFDQINDIFVDGNQASIMYYKTVGSLDDMYDLTYGDERTWDALKAKYQPRR